MMNKSKSCLLEISFLLLPAVLVMYSFKCPAATASSKTGPNVVILYRYQGNNYDMLDKARQAKRLPFTDIHLNTININTDGSLD